MSGKDNLDFFPKQIVAGSIRLGPGSGIRQSLALTQRLAARRAIDEYPSGRDWMDKLSSAYVAAIATRSADVCLMQYIQNSLAPRPNFACAKCMEASIGHHVLRAQLFPRLVKLRKHANALIHHLEDPTKTGIVELNIRGVFEYCYHLFQENDDALFGNIPQGSFEVQACKVHKPKLTKTPRP